MTPTRLRADALEALGEGLELHQTLKQIVDDHGIGIAVAAVAATSFSARRKNALIRNLTIYHEAKNEERTHG